MKMISLLAVLVLCLMVTNLLRGARSNPDKSWFDEMFARESVPVAKPSPQTLPEAPLIAEAPLQNPEVAAPAVPPSPHSTPSNVREAAKPTEANRAEAKPANAKPSEVEPQKSSKQAQAAPVKAEKPRSLPSTELAKISTGQKLVCKKPGEPPRSLTIERNKGRFELIYERPDGAEAVAWSQSNAKPCQQIRERISRKLESAGYHCAADVAGSADSPTNHAGGSG